MPNQYEIPRWGTPSDLLLGWCLEARQEGEAWLGAQAPARQWDAALELLSGPDRLDEASSMSNTNYPKSKRIARELVASLANFRHEGEFKVLWDNSLYDQAHLLTDLDRNWYTTTYANDVHRQGLQYGVGLGTGYWLEEWDPHYWGPYKGDIRLTALHPNDVTFVQLPKDGDIQRAYAVIIKFELPINLARRMWMEKNPGFAASLVPDQQSPSWLQKGLAKVQQFLSPALRVAGKTRQQATGSFPTVNIYHMYSLDSSINTGFDPVQMGAPGTNWAYTVPAMGDPLPTGIMNPETGEQFTRAAVEKDCLLFPLRRLTIFSNTGVAYDGSSPNWHGDVPVARVRFNDWPWEALGGSLVSDIRTMEGGITALMRMIEDSAAARLDPPYIYDDRVVSKEWASAFNPRMAGSRAAADLNAGEILKFPVDPHYYDVPVWITQFMQEQEGRMDYISGVRDMIAIAKAKQVPGADTLEKLFEMAGPIVQDLVRQVEKPMAQLGEWRKALYFQYYNSARIIRTVGPDEFDPQAWNYGPDRLAEIDKNQSYQFKPEMLQGIVPGETMQARTSRLKRYISEFRYEVTESGINEIHRMTTKLFYLQLMKEGFPISWWTFARIAKIPNFGPPPEKTNNEMERWIAQQHMKIELQGELQKEALLAQAEAQSQVGGGLPPGGPGGAPGGNGGPPGQIPEVPNIGENTQRGRSQSYQAPPRMIQKDHGARTTITTAKQ